MSYIPIKTMNSSDLPVLSRSIWTKSKLDSLTNIISESAKTFHQFSNSHHQHRSDATILQIYVTQNLGTRFGVDFVEIPWQQWDFLHFKCVFLKKWNNNVMTYLRLNIINRDCILLWVTVYIQTSAVNNTITAVENA